MQLRRASSRESLQLQWNWRHGSGTFTMGSGGTSSIRMVSRLSIFADAFTTTGSHQSPNNKTITFTSIFNHWKKGAYMNRDRNRHTDTTPVMRRIGRRDVELIARRRHRMRRRDGMRPPPASFSKRSDKTLTRPDA